MNLTLEKTITDNIVIIDDTSTYDSIVREDFAGFLFLTNPKTTGDVNVPTPVLISYNDNQWAFPNLADGYYKADLLLIPLISYISGNPGSSNITKGALVVDDTNGKVYRSLNTVEKEDDNTFAYPHLNLANWIEVPVISFNSVYDSTFIPAPGSLEVQHKGSISFIYYNNLINAYTKLAKDFVNTAKCSNDYLDRLRALRDKYEAVELAAAAANYLGAQIIIESSDNFLCNTSC